MNPTKDKAIKGFKAVKFMREVRDQISIEIKDMNFAELKKYYEDRRLKLATKQEVENRYFRQTFILKMENNNLLNFGTDWNDVSSKEWKQKIQFELKGEDYNETLIWNSPEDIQVKPFYHNDESVIDFNIETKATDFKICQNINNRAI